MDASIPKAIWDFKNKNTRDRAFQIYTEIIGKNSNQGLAIGMTLQTLQREGADMTKGYVPEAVPGQQNTTQIPPTTGNIGTTPTTGLPTATTSQKPQSLPKQSFVQPYLFNPDDYR